MSGVPPGDLGAASGMTNVSQQVGGAIGLALLATLSASRTRALAAHGQSGASAAVGGEHLAVLVAAAILGFGLILSAVVLRTPARAAATARPH
jgi:hypothetical protein